MHMHTSVYVYLIYIRCMHTQDTRRRVFPWCQYISTRTPWGTLPLSSEYYRLVLALWAGEPPHSHHNWHLWVDTEVYLNHMCLEENAHSCTCFQRCECSLWVALDWCWYNCFTGPLWVKGSGLCSVPVGGASHLPLDTAHGITSYSEVGACACGLTTPSQTNQKGTQPLK